MGAAGPTRQLVIEIARRNEEDTLTIGRLAMIPIPPSNQRNQRNFSSNDSTPLTSDNSITLKTGSHCQNIRVSDRISPYFI